ncbi:MAG TPA: GatB/YqeY domain-containing protein [Croceibacterium sp.]|nr:GatB/YqeY domain-containing protein [Croceibacterium sp.]
MSAAALKARLRADLKAAMQAKASGDVRVLRVLIAALDNAEAVAGAPDRHVPRAFGDPAGEVARLDLDPDAISRLLAAEIDARRAAAADYERHGRHAEAASLREEIARVERYRDS